MSQTHRFIRRHAFLEMTTDAEQIARRVRELGCESTLGRQLEQALAGEPLVVPALIEKGSRALGAFFLLKQDCTVMIFGSCKAKWVMELSEELQLMCSAVLAELYG
jgi:hypothetical protein